MLTELSLVTVVKYVYDSMGQIFETKMKEQLHIRHDSVSGRGNLSSRKLEIECNFGCSRIKCAIILFKAKIPIMFGTQCQYLRDFYPPCWLVKTRGRLIVDVTLSTLDCIKSQTNRYLMILINWKLNQPKAMNK